MDQRFTQWAEQTAVFIRFKPDRSAVASELAAHLEDKYAMLERCGYDHQLAASRSLEAMGDPKAVGRALDRAHKPWLGWLWICSKTMPPMAAGLILRIRTRTRQ